MIKLHEKGVFVSDGRIVGENELPEPIKAEDARKNTIAASILTAHNTREDGNRLHIKFDALASHDITYVGIIQSARASGLDAFPVPYILTNCHNSLCAVGGTINEDDHLFGLSAAKRYGGIFVPAHQAVIHSYMRETVAGGGKMILGSDSHTRYGALGTMAIGEGGPELARQLMSRSYDIDSPDIIAVILTGEIQNGVGPQDVALAIIGAVFEKGIVKNKVMEFIGDGIADLPVEFRNGIDVMTTETACLSSIWATDGKVEKWLSDHKRPNDFKRLKPNGIAYYDGAIEVDLSKIEPMIALPYHPSNVYTIRELKANAAEILTPLGLDGKIFTDGIHCDQGVIAGCAGGTYDNLCAAASILKDGSVGCGEFGLSVYPASQPTLTAVIKNGVAAELLNAGVILRSAFCGPCFGAGDVPSNGGFSIRHSTRNFPNREGSKPSAGQSASVALMDARSIAATALNGGVLTSAAELDIDYDIPEYDYDDSAYRSRVYNGFGKPDRDVELCFGPNIKDWPKLSPLADNIVMQVVSVINDPVTTTDELIPSGETSSYRSNPMKLAEYTLSRKDPKYVQRAKDANVAFTALPKPVRDAISTVYREGTISVGSTIFAVKPGDGSAREQAASCQRILGGMANIANEYATKRYRSNLINWGMLPLLNDGRTRFTVGDYVFIPDARYAVRFNTGVFDCYIIKPSGEASRGKVRLGSLSDEEKDIILAGCLINYLK